MQDGQKVLLGKYHVPLDTVKQSDLYSGLLLSPLSQSLALPLPESYQSHIIEDYVAYLRSGTKAVEDMKNCLQLAHLISDTGYLQHLVEQMLNRWSCYSAMVAKLNIELQHDIYLHLPIVFIPEQPLLHDKVFVSKWIAKHKPLMCRNTKIIVEDSEYAHEYYETVQSKNVECFRDSEQCLDVSWFLKTGKINMYTQHCGHNQINGVCKAWHCNGKLKMEGKFENDKQIGDILRWDEDGNQTNTKLV
jgi:hypothetical protein